MEAIEEKAMQRAWCEYRNQEYVEGHVNPLPSDNFERGYRLGSRDALVNQWRDPKKELPMDGEIVLIREYYRSAKSGRYVNHVKEFMFFEQYGFDLEERIHKHLKYRITHWMPIPALPTKQ